MAFVLAVVTAVLYLPRVFLPTEGLDTEPRLEAENDLRPVLVQLLGGSVLLFGTAWTLHINREGQITDRFSRAIDHLGEDKLDVRLGGIYALERIARDSKPDRGPIAEVLSAFVREHTRPVTRGADGESEDALLQRAASSPAVPSDIQAAATVLARNLWPHPVDLTGVDLRRADLMNAKLNGAKLNGGRLDRADFRHANLERAQLVKATLTEARLHWARLNHAMLVFADLRNADLGGAHLKAAQLANANLEGALLVRVDLKGANLTGANLKRATLTQANLAGADLEGANLEGADLEGAHLDGAHLEGAHGLEA